MPSVFIYEHITGGGMLSVARDAIASSLSREGRAMADALASDFSALEGVHVTVLRDQRFDASSLQGCSVVPISNATDELQQFTDAAARADWTVIIAPEFDGILLERCQLALAAGARLLGPSADIVRLCSDKHATALHLKQHGVQVPRGDLLSEALQPPQDVTFPAVLKPRDGAGSQGVKLCVSVDELLTQLELSGSRPHAFRLEEFCTGTAVSVAAVCGPDGVFPLVPCTQWLSRDGNFEYLGGSLPLTQDRSRRASSLATCALRTLDAPIGYIGVDLVLGDASDGTQDYVIEINPRLTTSYIGLRKAAEQNLAGAMISIAGGESRRVTFHDTKVEFRSDGTVHRFHSDKSHDLART